MKMKPVGHRLLVKVELPEDLRRATKGGIILTDDTLRKHQEAAADAIVVAIGPNAFKAFDDGEPWCKVGDTIKMVAHAGVLASVDKESGDQYRFINDEDVIGVAE